MDDTNKSVYSATVEYPKEFETASFEDQKNRPDIFAGSLMLDLDNKYMYQFPVKAIIPMIESLFLSINDMLKFYQSTKNKSIGFSLIRDKGDFVFGAILTYREPDNEEDGGSWYLSYTFDEEDVEKCEVKLNNHSDVFVTCGFQELHNTMGARPTDAHTMQNLFIGIIDCIVKFLGTNVSEERPAELSLEGVFTATMAYEDGERVISLVPGENIKQGIKNDSAL